VGGKVGKGKQEEGEDRVIIHQQGIR